MKCQSVLNADNVEEKLGIEVGKLHAEYLMHSVWYNKNYAQIGYGEITKGNLISVTGKIPDGELMIVILTEKAALVETENDYLKSADFILMRGICYASEITKELAGERWVKPMPDTDFLTTLVAAYRSCPSSENTEDK